MSIKNNIGVIIQARTGSSRLPNKVILPFYNGKGILEILLDRLIESNIEVPIIVATTKNKEDLRVVELAKKKNIECFRGDEHNVLKRFVDAALKFKLDKIIRVCADNPFLDIHSLENLINYTKSTNNDYISFKVDGKPTIKTHYGFWAEAVTVNALKKIRERTTLIRYTEHVTNYIYENDSLFEILFLDVEQKLPKWIRLTLDTKEDFDIQKNIYSILIKKDGSKISLDNTIRYIIENPNVIELMKQQIFLHEK